MFIWLHQLVIFNLGWFLLLSSDVYNKRHVTTHRLEAPSAIGTLISSFDRLEDIKISKSRKDNHTQFGSNQDKHTTAFTFFL